MGPHRYLGCGIMWAQMLIQDLTPVKLNWNWKNTQLLLMYYWILHQTKILPLKRNRHTTNYEYIIIRVVKNCWMAFYLCVFAVVLLPWASALSPRSCPWWWESWRIGPSLSSIHPASQRFSLRLRVGHSFTIWAWWIQTLYFWNMPVSFGKKKTLLE